MTPAATLDRRRFLAALGAVAGSVAIANPGRASAATQSTSSKGGPARSALDPYALARRLSYGPDAALLAVASRGLDAYLDDQLNPLKTENPALRDVLDALSDLESDLPADTSATSRGQRRRFALGATTTQSLARAAFSTRQLHAVLADVLSDQLHVAIPGDPHVFFVPAYDREVVDAHALARFDVALAASARHPAMLLYLDQANSRADGKHVPNENYARELLELHTVGRSAGYSEAEVQAAAHVLSGWTLTKRAQGVKQTFRFDPSRHDLGPASTQTILGWKANDAGEADGAALLAHLAQHPRTAQRVSARVARRLIDDTLPDGALPDTASPDTGSTVAAIARAYSANNTSLAATAEAAIRHPAFARGLSTNARARRPLDAVVAVLRAGAATVAPSDVARFATTWYRLLGSIDAIPYGWPAPDGYPEPDAAYTSPGAIIARWNVVSAVVMTTTVPGLTLTWPDSVESIGEALLGARVPAELSRVVANEVGRSDNLSPDRRALAAALYAASPQFQLR